MVPALVSVFDSEVTWLGCVTTRSVWVGEAFRPVLLYRQQCCRISPYETRSSGYRAPHGYSRFGSVSSESHWQALPHVFGCAFHG